MRAEIEAYYERGGEVERLASGAGRLEFLRTWDVLTRVLPPAPARVLDVGGATGVYAAPLAEAGYDVALVDPVASHVAVAASLPGVAAVVGDARALGVRDGTVDAVLLLGPLYHLTDRADRLRAWREAARVTRPGGVVVAATISRYASFLGGFVESFLNDADFVGIVRGDLATGVHRNPEHVPGWFTTAYFHHPNEPAAEARDAGLDVDRVVAVEGPLWMAAALDGVLMEEHRTVLMMDLLRQVEEEPSLYGASAHLLTVARRP
jgi:SAM-dependent methyltransferase